MQRQRGKCPLCGEYLLHADTEPQHPGRLGDVDHRNRKAIRYQAVAVLAETGGANDRKVSREQLFHAYCAKRQEQQPFAHLRASLSRSQ